MMLSGHYALMPDGAHGLLGQKHPTTVHLSPVNPEIIHKLIQHLKINGIFDEMRKECLADIDTKPAFLNLKQRVESHVKGILTDHQWRPSLNKNQLRSGIRESVMKSGILDEGVDRILQQVFNAKAQTVFLPKVQEFVKDKGQSLIQDLMLPHSLDISSSLHQGPLPPPPDPEIMIEEEDFQPPIPVQPPPPEPPVKLFDENKDDDAIQPAHPKRLDVNVPDASEEIMTNENHAFCVQDVVKCEVPLVNDEDSDGETVTPDQVCQKEEETPKIPADAVNPLRSLIKSLLVSKQTLNLGEEPENAVEIEGEVRVEDFSPTIDSSQIESFTDEEDESTLAKDTSHQAYSPKPLAFDDNEMDQSSTKSQSSELYSPLSTYTPISPARSRDENMSAAEELPETSCDNSLKQYSRLNSNTEERKMLPYDPSKFSYEHISDSSSLNEESGSAPSPTEGVESRLARNVSADNSDSTPYEIAPYRNVEYDEEEPLSSPSSSVGSMEKKISEHDIVMASHMQESVEEMVEEIEVVEEVTTTSEEEMDAPVHSELKKEKKIPKAYQEKKRKKRMKKKKVKKSKLHKRPRSSSISSGEITSSDSDSTSSSRPTRPPRLPNSEPKMLSELEQRRTAHMRDNFADRHYWQNADSSSDFISGSPMMRRPFSPPPGRPYSPPDMRRFESGRDMRYVPPPPGPPFRERPVYRDEYRPRARFSPPPYRRSPPHRYSPGPRLEYPRMPFGPNRSPRRSYSPPPHIYHGDPRPFTQVRHRWSSPPRQGAALRIPSRSPPPGIRRDGPGPSRY